MSPGLPPVIDPRILERRLVDEDRSPVLIVTAATQTQRRLITEFAREVAGDLLVDLNEPHRPIKVDAPTAVERGFTISALQIETAQQADGYLDAFKSARIRYRGFILVIPPNLATDTEGPLHPWMQPGMVVCASSNDANAPFPLPSRFERDWTEAAETSKDLPPTRRQPEGRFMNQHDDPPWPWPTRAESERFSHFLKEPGVLIEEHQYPESIHVMHSDGRSLWAAMLDPLPVTSKHIPEGPLSSPVHPLIAEDRTALNERVKAVVRAEAAVYGARVQSRSPRRKNPYLDAEIKDLTRQRRRSWAEGGRAIPSRRTRDGR